MNRLNKFIVDTIYSNICRPMAMRMQLLLVWLVNMSNICVTNAFFYVLFRHTSEYKCILNVLKIFNLGCQHNVNIAVHDLRAIWGRLFKAGLALTLG
jgi:hypothetical protein